MKKYFKEMTTEKYIFWGIIILLFAVRVAAFFDLGATYNLDSDDANYVLSGMHFAKTGELIMHGVRSAQIMPLLTWMLAILSVFGRTFEGTLILGRILMFVFGVASALEFMRLLECMQNHCLVIWACYFSYFHRTFGWIISFLRNRHFNLRLYLRFTIP
ncbi:hypothetical protein MGH68_07425 [Erysipelothrix sp. D19-032]